MAASYLPGLGGVICQLVYRGVCGTGVVASYRDYELLMICFFIPSCILVVFGGVAISLRASCVLLNKTLSVIGPHMDAIINWSRILAV